MNRARLGDHYQCHCEEADAGSENTPEAKPKKAERRCSTFHHNEEVRHPQVHLAESEFVGQREHVRGGPAEPVERRNGQGVALMQSIECCIELRAAAMRATDAKVDMEVFAADAGAEAVVPATFAHTTSLRRYHRKVSCNRRFCHTSGPPAMRRGIKTQKGRRWRGSDGVSSRCLATHRLRDDRSSCLFEV